MSQRIYRPSLALLTDLYQLTMAQGYWKLGRAEQEAVFHLTFRRHPFRGEYSVAGGLSALVDHVRHARLADEDIRYLQTLTGNDGQPLFEAGFIEYLAALEYTCDIDAVEEGTVVFPHEPLVRVQGPLVQCQLLETPLLNIVNFATLIATKASRVCQAAGDDAVLEFGLRRAQGVDGGLTASRAAYLGGCAGTSNVLAGRLFDIPVKGTHAHSWVMSFDDELEAFRAYAEVMPNNCVFLVDTYDTAEGVRHAITTGEALRARGFRLAGVRLDSGDLAALSRHARSALDEAGFGDASIVASNDLDEYAIRDLKGAGAAIDVWGIGTKLATAYDQPALGGVYKLSAIRDEDGRWTPRVKLSEQPIKTSNPGIQQVRRYYDSDGNMLGDVLFDTLDGDAPTACAAGASDPELDFDLPAGAEHQDLLVPIFRGGEQVRACPSLADARAHRAAQLARLPEAHRRLDEPRPYPVALDEGLYETRSRLIRQARGEQS